MIAAPTAAKLITSAMICRCFDCRRRRKASTALTPFSSLTAAPGAAAGSRFSRRMISSTRKALTSMHAALGRSRFVDPIVFAYAVTNADAAMPPSGAPPPMKPNSRFAWRGSYTMLASVQNWLMRRTPRIKPMT